MSSGDALRKSSSLAAAVKTSRITRQESQFYMTCISTISIVRKNWIPGIDNTRMTLLWRLTSYTMWCLVVTALCIFIASLVTNSLLMSRVTFSLSRGCSRLRCLAPTEVVSDQVSRHPAVTRHLPPHPPCRSRPSIFPEHAASLSSPGLRALTHRHFLITRAALSSPASFRITLNMFGNDEVSWDRV